MNEEDEKIREYLADVVTKNVVKLNSIEERLEKLEKINKINIPANQELIEEKPKPPEDSKCWECQNNPYAYGDKDKFEPKDSNWGVDERTGQPKTEKTIILEQFREIERLKNSVAAWESKCLQQVPVIDGLNAEIERLKSLLEDWDEKYGKQEEIIEQALEHMKIWTSTNRPITIEVIDVYTLINELDEILEDSTSLPLPKDQSAKEELLKKRNKEIQWVRDMKEREKT